MQIKEFLRKDSMVKGILFGLLIPIIAFGLLQGLNLIVADNPDLLKTKRGFLFSQRLITITSICFNAVPAQKFLNRKEDESIRGIVFPTFAFLTYWMITYLPNLLDNF